MPRPPEPLTLWVAASTVRTVREILNDADIDLAPDRSATTWAGFLRSQAEALPACDFLETVTLTGARMYVLAVIEHHTRRIRVPGATAHPTAAWVTQTARNAWTEPSTSTSVPLDPHGRGFRQGQCRRQQVTSRLRSSFSTAAIAATRL